MDGCHERSNDFWIFVVASNKQTGDQLESQDRYVSQDGIVGLCLFLFMRFKPLLLLLTSLSRLTK
jgi:hypothetical protein